MNSNQLRVLPIVFTFFLAASIGFGQASRYRPAEAPAIAPVGTMVYLDGDVDVHRNGEFLEWEVIDIGLEIEDYDLVQTGKTGIAQVELFTPATRNSTITITENTAFYFDVSRLENTNRTAIEMLSGSIMLKVTKLVNHDVVVVRTPSIVMGVRGTEFGVTAMPDGSYLITCNTGEVVCEDDSGAQQIALAGQAVEKTLDVFRSIAVPVTELERYRTDWIAERERIFRSGAATFVRAFAQQYASFEPRFVEALSGLLEQRDVFEIWTEAYRNGVEIPTAELFLQRSSVTPAMVEVRSVLPVYEQLYYRLKTLERFHAQGIGRTTIERGLTSTAFFEGFLQNARTIEKGLAVIRYYLKLYARMTGFEDSSLIEEIFSGNPLGGSGPPAPTDPRTF